MQEHGVIMSEDAIVSLLTDRVMEQITLNVPWRPGAQELLSELRDHGIRTALVTMSIGRMAEYVRSLIPFDAFDYVVSGDKVVHSKPHPEAYLTAAKLLNTAAQNCVAIEDSVAGVTSAVAAGCNTIGVPHYLSLDESPAQVLWPTLEGRSAADIAAFYTQRCAERRNSIPEQVS
jgi:HAD superfamily hydrolase (TIGR01509 family)